MRRTIIVQSMERVDLSELVCPIIVVYQNPMDFPGYCLARVFDGTRPTNTAVLKRFLVEIQRDIEKYTTGMHFITRTENDPLSVIGVWI